MDLAQGLLDQIYHRIELTWKNSGAWPDFIEAMRRALPCDEKRADPRRDPARWALLPGLCCQAAGGDPQWAEVGASAWFLLYCAAHLFDSLEDQDPLEPWWAANCPGVAINAATGLIFSAASLLNRLGSAESPHRVDNVLVAEFYDHILVMSSGQHRDLTTTRLDLNTWFQLAEAKSGAFFSLACRTGASLATEDPTYRQAYGKFGAHLGILIQILDDLEDFRVLRSSENGTHQAGLERSLPGLYALEVLPPEEKQLINLYCQSAGREPEAVEELIQILEGCGTDLFLDMEIERQKELARAALQAASPASPAGEELLALIEQLVQI